MATQCFIDTTVCECEGLHDRSALLCNLESACHGVSHIIHTSTANTNSFTLRFALICSKISYKGRIERVSTCSVSVSDELCV